ncbi:MAG: AraC family transcriptional regulator [Bryobacterales bacterium]|nr:AraC family transcriptional regulator [Bryobacterales bacterium]
MDPLTDIVMLLRPRAAFSKPITGKGRWGVRYESHGGPSFCIVQNGHCWLTLGDQEPLLLAEGDFLLSPLTPSFTMQSELGAVCVTSRPARTGVRYGAPRGRPDFRMIGGSFEVDMVNSALLELVSQTIHVRAAEFDTSRLAKILELLLDEYRADRPGRETILQHFLEAMLVEALRWPCLRTPLANPGTPVRGERSTGGSPCANDDAGGAGWMEARPGLIVGLRDAQIARALRVMHADVAHAWTVATLAKCAGMSRSAFATRFTERVGCAPLEYLTRWRMSLAQDALSRGGRSLEGLAVELGYQSASAFSTAFRKRLGCPPGAFARRARAGA